MLIRETSDRVTNLTNGNLFRHALIIIIELASRYFARSDTSSALSLFGMRSRCEKRIAARVYAISHGDGSGMATVVRVVRTFLN